jgi:ribosome biogenesis GTPase
VLDVILPRRSVIARLTAQGDDRQVLAANVDLVFILHGLDRTPKLRRLERTLVVAWDSAATPIIVLTKTDLLDGGGDGAAVAAVVGDVQAVAPGVEVIAVSNETGHGIEAIDRRIGPGTTVVLIGESGAGKSSLVNRLLGEERQVTAETRAGDAKGRHTTTSRELIPLPQGGVLIDTPGLRGLGLWEAGDGIALAFSDLEELAASCKFRDCNHANEPGCGVVEAVERGELDPARLASYQKLQKELDDGRRY